MPAATIVPIATNLYFGAPSSITADIKHRLATRHRLVFLQNGPDEVLPPAGRPDLLGPADWSAFGALALELKAIEPSVKVGLYVGGTASPDSHHVGFEWIADADTIHKLDGTPAQLVPSASPAPDGARRMKTINYSRAATRSKFIGNWVSWLASHHMDALLYDTWDIVAYADFLRNLGCPTGALEGPVHTEAWWADVLPTWTTDLTEGFASSGMECWVNSLHQPGSHHYNPLSPVDQILGPDQTRSVQYATGALSESSYPEYLDVANLQLTLTQRAQIAGYGGRMFAFQQPQLFDYYYGGGANAHPIIPPMARFYLAAHLLADDGTGTDAYGYHDQAAYRGWVRYGAEAGTKYLYDGGNDWDLDPGTPVGDVVWDTGVPGVSVAVREYEHAYVVANPNSGAGGFRVQGRYRNWSPDDGPVYIVSSDSPLLGVDAHVGMLLFKQPVPATGSIWSVSMRARLMHVAQDEDGNVLPGRAVTLYKADGVTLFDQVLYDAPSGGAVVTAPATDGLGRLTLYAVMGVRVKLAVGGVLGQYDSEFTVDPEDVRQSNQPVVIDEIPGDTEYLVSMQPTVGGSGGNKGLLILNADDTTLARTGPHGLSGVSNGLATDTALSVNRLLLVDPNNPPRILGDLSAAAASRRLVIQSSVTNGSSDLAIAPNGAGTRGAISALARSSLDATEGVRLYSALSAEHSVLETFATGGLTAQKISIRPNQTTSIEFFPNGDIAQKDGGLPFPYPAVPTGFLYLASSMGIPSGVPTARSGLVPICVDRQTPKLWVYVAGAWRGVALS